MKVIYVLAGLLIVGALVMFALGPGTDLIVSSALPTPVDNAVELDSLEPQHPGAISQPRKLEIFAGISVGWWFDEGPSLLLTSGSLWGRLNEKFEPTMIPSRTGEFRELVNLAGPSEVMVAVVEESDTFGRQIVGLNREGQEVWRHGPVGVDFRGPFAPLYGKRGLEGVAFGLGPEDGLVALDLGGHTLWQGTDSDPTSKLMTHPALPGLLVRIADGNVEWISHGSNPSGFALVAEAKREATGRTSLAVEYSYPLDGVLFANRHGQPQLVFMCGDIKGGSWLLSEDRQGARAWGIHVADLETSWEHQALGIAILGESQGVTYFAMVLEGGTIFVLDEDGGLLDRTQLADMPDGPGPMRIRGVSGGKLANGTHALILDVIGSQLLLKVELP